MSTGYFNLQSLSDALQVNKNPFKIVFFFRSPIRVSDLRYFYAKLDDRIIREENALEGYVPDNMDDYDFENNVYIYPATTSPDSIYTPDLQKWEGYDLVCIVFDKCKTLKND